MNQDVWSLAHIARHYQISGLSTEESVGFLAALPPEERTYWYVWKEGWTDWVKCTDRIELKVAEGMTPWHFYGAAAPVVGTLGASQLSASIGIDITHANAKLTLPKNTVKESTQETRVRKSQSVTTHTSYSQPHPTQAPTKVAGREKRRYPRVSLRLKVVVMADGKKAFRAHSTNVSMGGILLDKKIPTLHGICHVFLSNENSSEQIGFRARILSSADDPFRLAFEDCDASFQTVLQNWIQAASTETAA